MEKIVALVDCNSFFCSCERLFRPDLKKKPVIVLSNNDGCVVSRTKEAKLFNIPMGVPYFKIRDLCEKNRVEVFSSNFSLYSEISHRVMESLSRLAPVVEYYSIDEAFLDLTGIANLRDYAKKMKEIVEREVGIPVSVGISKTKVLAKVASEIAKNGSGISVLLTPDEIENALLKFPVRDLWGIGRSSEEKLKRVGVHYASELLKMGEERVRALLTKTGSTILFELQGEMVLPIFDGVSKSETIMSSRSFGKKVTDLHEIKEAIAHHVSLAAEKLRAQESFCHCITVFMRTNFFGDGPHYSGVLEEKLSPSLFDTRDLIKVAHKLCDKIYRGGYLYAKCGVVLSHFSDERQLDLFNGQGDERLMEVMDCINERNGPLFLRSAACGTHKKEWFVKQERKSPSYLGSWRDLPIVR